MKRRRAMSSFARWHIRLGWVVAVPLLLWTISGLFMTVRPIEEVRGENLRAEPPAIAETGLALPQLSGPVRKLTLVALPAEPVWVVTGTDDMPRRYSARTGALLGDVGEEEARSIARAAFASKAALTAMRRFPADAPPLDLRRPRPSWQATFADGTHVYVDAGTGEVLALRTRFWRAYDFMWGLHIMDPSTREDTSNPWLWIFGGMSLIAALLGSILLFRRRARGK